MPSDDEPPAPTTGCAGQKGAIQGAKLGKHVAIVEKVPVLGGVQVNTGTIPSKAVREAALHLTFGRQAKPVRPELPRQKTHHHL